MTVSPAPVTSATSRAVAGRCPSKDSSSSHMPCSPRVMSTPRRGCAIAKGARGRLRVGFPADAQVRRDLRLVVVRRDQRGARVVLEVRDLRIDQQRHTPLTGDRRQARHQCTRDGALQVIGHHNRLHRLGQRHRALDERRLDRAGRLGVRLVVHARHLLIAGGHDAHLRRGAPLRVGEQAAGRDAVRLQPGAQRRCRRVGARPVRRDVPSRRARRRCWRRWPRRQPGSPRARRPRSAPGLPARCARRAPR